jgi:D-glycero-D-manno-heptose 1,7-bisphosphate phosphatase
MRDEIRAFLSQPLIWEQRFNSLDGPPRPALFLDRDGVINKDAGYVGDPKDVVMNTWAIDLILEANGLGFPTVVVTNQSGVGRGYFTWHEFWRVQEKIASEMSAAGARLDLVLACGSNPDGKDVRSIAALPMRKPNPGMILRAAEVLPIDLRRSVLVGDRASDLAAAATARLAEAWLVQDSTGRSRLPDAVRSSTLFRSCNPDNGIVALMTCLRSYAD